MFDTAMATQEMILFMGYIAGVLSGVIAGICGLLVSLVGLGWGIRKFLKWITGSEGGLTYGMEAEHDMRNRVWKGGGNEM